MSFLERDAQVARHNASNPSEVCTLVIASIWIPSLTHVHTERRQRSSDSLEQQQRQPKQSKIDIEQLPQRFRKLMLSTIETVPRGVAVENTLPRFRPERVCYSGCRPFLEGWLGVLSWHHLSFLVSFYFYWLFCRFRFERCASMLAFVFSWASKKHRKQLTKKKGGRREHHFFLLSLFTSSFVTSSIWCYWILIREEFGEREKQHEKRPTESSYLFYCILAVRTHIWKSKPRSLYILFAYLYHPLYILMMAWSEGRCRKEVEGCREIGEIDLDDQVLARSCGSWASPLTDFWGSVLPLFSIHVMQKSDTHILSPWSDVGENCRKEVTHTQLVPTP